MNIPFALALTAVFFIMFTWVHHMIGRESKPVNVVLNIAKMLSLIAFGMALGAIK